MVKTVRQKLFTGNSGDLIPHVAHKAKPNKISTTSDICIYSTKKGTNLTVL